MPATPKNALLGLLIFSQFAGTSLWFVGNAIIDSLPGVKLGNYANLTSVVQFGFITGTLVFSLFGIADRFRPPRVFLFSAAVAAAANLCILVAAGSLPAVLLMRFVTGFFLAGIYPVGMKIAADYFPDKLGKALGFLVGALVLGTAFPHFVRSLGGSLGWRTVITVSSLLAVFGGVLVYALFPKEKKAVAPQSFRLSAALGSFRLPAFRTTANGYFGHMWELYAFWAILPVVFTAYNGLHAARTPVYFWSFAVIGIGSIGCAVGGLLSQRLGSKKVAFYSLVLSGICCLLSPLVFQSGAGPFLLFMLAWGLSVTADSPQFSALVARYAEARYKGTALTLVTCIGFSITIASIQLIKYLFLKHGVYSLWLLAAGPVYGLVSLKRPD